MTLGITSCHALALACNLRGNCFARTAWLAHPVLFALNITPSYC